MPTLPTTEGAEALKPKTARDAYEFINGALISHKDYAVSDMFLQAPRRLKIAAEIINQDDFINFANEYKTEATKLFWISGSHVKVVFNYPTADRPDFGDNTAEMKLAYTEQFKELTTAFSAPLKQRDFVRTLKRLSPYIAGLNDECAGEIDVIEIAEQLQAVKTINSVERNFASKYVLDIVVKSAASNLELPRFITFIIPVFENDRENWEIKTELFCSFNEGVFSVELVCHNLSELVAAASRKIVDHVIEQSGIKAYRVG